MARLKHAEGAAAPRSRRSRSRSGSRSQPAKPQSPVPNTDTARDAGARSLPTSRWEAAGPFPAGMREHPFMASPLAAFGRFGDEDNTDAYDAYTDPEVAFAHAPFGKGDWPSELPTGGRAGWAGFEEREGVVEIRYPDVRWAQLRADHGWAALQYTAVLRARITIPGAGELGRNEATRVLVDAAQVVEYAFVPASGGSDEPLEWYAGDVYGFGDTPAGRAGAGAGPSNFARPLALVPGEYVLLARVLYECRMFGDPGDAPPTIKIALRVYLDDNTADVAAGASPYLHTPSPLAHPHPNATILSGLTLVPDLLDGWALGRWVTVNVRVPPLNHSAAGAGTGVVEVTAEGYGDGLTLGTTDVVHIAPGQTRPVPLLMAQLERSDARELEIILTLSQGGKEWQIETRVPLKHLASRDNALAMMTFPVGKPPVVSAAAVLPPCPSILSPRAPADLPPVLLALHGAGVPTPSDEWADAMPRLPGMWAVMPSGRTEWGEDWHGGSLTDVWAARSALNELVERAGHTVSSETVLIGHSNGGQGVWHAAARFPDRIRGMVAVAGYTKIQDYVPYTETTGAHYADPALQGVLVAALAPYNNDLYLSNLASVPVLAVHGADDDNVPPRHGRAQAAILSAWLGSPAPKDVRFVEVPHAGHVWDGVLRHPAILHFLATLPRRRTADEVRTAGFTLATANPDESGAKAGIRIAELAVPGRLARLDVNARQWRRPGAPPLDIHGTNVRRVDIVGWAEGGVTSLEWSRAERTWLPTGSANPATGELNTTLSTPRRYGPVLRLLDSGGPLALVVGAGPAAARARAIATRYAHDLHVHHRMDVRILDAVDALHAAARGAFESSNIVVVGGPEQNTFAAYLLAQKRVPVAFPTRGVMTVEGRVVWEQGTGIITLLPFPLSNVLACLVAGNDDLGLELAARLLPLRTGVPVPDWAVVSPRMRWQGAGGLIGAGFWGADWGWSEAMSWFDRE